MLAAAIHSTVSSNMERVPPSVSYYIYAMKQSNDKQLKQNCNNQIQKNKVDMYTF